MERTLNHLLQFMRITYEKPGNSFVRTYCINFETKSSWLQENWYKKNVKHFLSGERNKNVI